jgi:hypothetical protein
MQGIGEVAATNQLSRSVAVGWAFFVSGEDPKRINQERRNKHGIRVKTRHNHNSKAHTISETHFDFQTATGDRIGNSLPSLRSP